MSVRAYASPRSTLGLALLVLAAAPFAGVAGQDAVVMMTSQQDHDRQMRLLKISGFPPGPDAYQAATYDEAAASAKPRSSPQR